MEQYLIGHSSHDAPPFIDGATVFKLLDVPSMLDVLQEGLINYSAGSEGGVHMPVRTVVPVGGETR